MNSTKNFNFLQSLFSSNRFHQHSNSTVKYVPWWLDPDSWHWTIRKNEYLVVALTLGCGLFYCAGIWRRVDPASLPGRTRTTPRHLSRLSISPMASGLLQLQALKPTLLHTVHGLEEPQLKTDWHSPASSVRQALYHTSDTLIPCSIRSIAQAAAAESQWRLLAVMNCNSPTG